jgi:O-antigen/teichoic acid export membrane protein
MYSLGSMLVVNGWGFVDHIANTVFPPIQRAAARNETSDVRWLYLRQSRLVLLFGLPMYLGFIFFGHAFMKLWMGEEFVDAGTVLVLLSTAKAVSLFNYGIGSTLTALGRVRFSACVSMAEAGVNLAAALLFTIVFGWGLVGVAGAALVATLLTCAPILPVSASRTFQLGVRTYLESIALPGLLAAGAISGCYAATRAVVSVDSWPSFCMAAGIAGAGGLGVAAVILLLPVDRRRIMRAVGFVG